MPLKQKIDPAVAVRNALVCFQDGVGALIESVGDGATAAAAAEIIFACKGRVILAGVGKSGHVARKLAATFASTGTPSHFVHPSEASHGDMGMIQKSDVLILLSWSGKTREMEDMINYAIRNAIPIIAITGAADSVLAQKATVALTLPAAQEACPHNLAPTTSTLLQLAMGDALAVTLLRMRGFSEASYRNFHPGGSLGAKLLPVSDVMLKGDDLPLVSKSAPIIQVIAESSRGSFGIVGLLDDDGLLTGVMTDGDIRRYLEANSTGTMQDVIWNAKADALVRGDPITLTPERLCARALNVLETKKISAAFVIDDDGRPVGLITLLRLLQQGVA